MTIEQMRWKLMGVYPPGDWQDRVTNMSPAQVHSSYMRFLNAGKIYKEH